MQYLRRYLDIKIEIFSFFEKMEFQNFEWENICKFEYEKLEARFNLIRKLTKKVNIIIFDKLLKVDGLLYIFHPCSLN